MLTLTNFDKNAIDAIREFSQADPADPGSWTVQQAVAYTALCLRLDIAHPDQLQGGMAPYDPDTARNLVIKNNADRNILTRFAALMQRPADGGAISPQNFKLCDHAKQILTPYLEKNNAYSPDNMEIDFKTYDRVVLPASDPACYGETSLTALQKDAGHYKTLRDVPATDELYEQIHHALGDRGPAPEGGPGTADHEGGVGPNGEGPAR